MLKLDFKQNMSVCCCWEMFTKFGSEEPHTHTHKHRNREHTPAPIPEYFVSRIYCVIDRKRLSKNEKKITETWEQAVATWKLISLYLLDLFWTYWLIGLFASLRERDTVCPNSLHPSWKWPGLDLLIIYTEGAFYGMECLPSGIVLFSAATVPVGFCAAGRGPNICDSYVFSSVKHKNERCLSAHLHSLSLLIHLFFQQLSFLSAEFWGGKKKKSHSCNLVLLSWSNLLLDFRFINIWACV